MAWKYTKFSVPIFKIYLEQIGNQSRKYKILNRIFKTKLINNSVFIFVISTFLNRNELKKCDGVIPDFTTTKDVLNSLSVIDNEQYGKLKKESAQFLYKDTPVRIFMFLIYAKMTWFIKIYREKKTINLIQKEKKNLNILSSRASIELKKTLPRKYHVLDVCGHPAFISEYFSGEKHSEFVSVIQPSIKNKNIIDKYFEKVTTWLIIFQKDTLIKEKSLDTLVEDVQSLWSIYQKSTKTSLTQQKNISKYCSQLSSNKHLTVKEVSSHGDLFPSNIIDQGNELKVIDWADMKTNALPVKDIYDFFLSYFFINIKQEKLDSLESFKCILFNENWFSQLVKKNLSHLCNELKYDPKSIELLLPLYLLQNAIYEIEEFNQYGGKKIKRKWRNRFEYLLENYDRLACVVT